ncbi:MAG: PKHD-type hydroxylase, partial [Alcanivorax sp.]
LNSGDLILYPSTSLHEVRPVTKGKRFAAFFWIQSLVPDANKREQLFELDQSIQVLTQDRGAEDQEVRRLSGLYHNLMRLWSQP